MGVIRKILYRERILGAPRHRNFFLDMEENIHIHYRDLRIELSRAEFEDIVTAFGKQSAELMAVILERGYQDGRLPNANQEGVRIWTESRLNHEVKYHPDRVSIEECSDGYHLHYRNYKILIDPPEFREIVRLFASLDVDSPYASTFEEVQELLGANDIDYVLDGGNIPDQLLVISVAHYHVVKVRDVLTGIGFLQENHGAERHYIGERLKVVTKVDRSRTALDYRRLKNYDQTVRLVDYLARYGSSDSNALNRIKCQVIDLYSRLRRGDKLGVEIEPDIWLYSPASGQVVFPYSSNLHGGKNDAERLYRAWSGHLTRLQLAFVKPPKDVFPKIRQQLLRDEVLASIRREVCAFIAVSRVFVMGSVLRGDMGRYQVPFVHGKWVKLGSDVDILVELDPVREKDVPAHWELINPESSNKCAVYHVAMVPIEGGPGEWAKQYPNIPFIDHLIDAYVYFPSRGFAVEKDTFLTRFKAQVIYDRSRDGRVEQGGEEARIALQVAEYYDLDSPTVERIKASTENAVFLVPGSDKDWVLKLFKVSGNYNRSRIAEHTAYEMALIKALRDGGVHVPDIYASKTGEVPVIDGYPALLFERIAGEVQQKPEYPINQIGAALAHIHNVNIATRIDVPQDFLFDDVCMIWLPQFSTYHAMTGLDAEISNALDRLSPIVDRLNPGQNRAALYARSTSVHCHGDVTPKNVIVVDGVPWFFDFNNAFFGPRMADVIDGAFEFSLAEKYIDLADFARFDAFIDCYGRVAKLSGDEMADLPQWLELIGIIKFTKELRVLIEKPGEVLRRRRALAIAEYVISHGTPT